MRVLKKIKGLYVFLAIALIAVVSVSVYAGSKAARFQEEMGEMRQMDWIIPLGKYDSVAVITGADGLYAVEKNNKYGIINRAGNTVLPLKYDAIMEHCNSGLIPVSREGRWGYVNEQGKIAIDLQYEYILPFQKGYASVLKYGESKIIDAQGREKYTSKFKDGNLMTTEKAGFAIQQWQVDEAKNIDRIEIIDIEKGKTVFSSDNYSNPQEYSEGLWCFSRSDGTGCEFLDDNFRPVFKKESDSYSMIFHEGLSVCNYNSVIEYFDKKGKTVIKMKGSQGYSFSEGIACVVTQKGGTFIDRKGKTLFSLPCYRNTIFSPGADEPRFKGGYCLWQGDNGKLGYLNKSGEYVVKPFFDKAGMTEHGEAAVTYGSKSGILKLPAQ